MGDVLLDALTDSLKIFPFLFLIYLVIELLEYGLNAARYSRLLSGRYAPLAGAALGLAPQCGFSVMAAKLYDRRLITAGTVMAVFISTSDEAFAILLTGGEAAKMLPLLLGVKFVFALCVGYGADFLLRKRERPALPSELREVARGKTEHGEEVGHPHGEEECGDCHAHSHGKGNCSDCAEKAHAEESAVTASDDCVSEDVCAHCAKKHSDKWDRYLFTPLRRSLVIFAYILAINIVFALLVYFIGESEITRFLSASGVWQPFLAGLVGLIPNCVSSVIISEVYVLGGLSFGSLVAGLSVNAGMGLVVLFKNKQAWRRNLTLTGALYGLSVLLGLALALLFPAL